jgi:arabinofuranosyltransferase
VDTVTTVDPQADDSSARAPSATAARLTWVLLFVVPLVVLLVGAWRYRWMSDDGFINLRVVRQIEAGHGPVFNRGERVEASTSPLWVAVLTLADVLLPLRLEWIAVVGGIAATLAGIGFVLWGAWHLLPERTLRASTVVIPTGIWALVAFVPTWKFASSGLENGLFTLWFGVTFALLVRWVHGQRVLPSAWVALLIGLAPLIRPDLAIFFVCLVLAVVVAASTSWPRRLAFVGVALIVPVLFEIFRMGYYDSLVPNTALAKEASRSWWSHGWPYVRDSGASYWLWIPLVALVLGGYLPLVRAFAHDRNRRAVALIIACAAAGMLHVVYVARVGGDFMHARMVLPGLTAFVAPVAVSAVERSVVRMAMPTVVIVWALISIGFLRSKEDGPIAFFGTPRNAVTVEDFGWQRGGPGRAWFTGPGVYYGTEKIDQPKHAGLPSSVVASYGVGIDSYALGPNVYVLDMLGLGDSLTAHLKLGRRGTAPGHEKPLPAPWAAARILDPSAQLNAQQFGLPPWFVARPLDHPTGTFAQRVEAARTALACGRLRELLARVDEPLTVGRFFTNIAHSFGDTQLRIAPEPIDAVHQFCKSASG